MNALSPSSRVLEVDNGNSLAAPLLECSESGMFLCLVLPTGKRVWVHPEESLRGLVQTLADPAFGLEVETAARHLSCGRGLVLNDSETPQTVAAEVIGNSAFAALIDQAAGDVRARRGTVLDVSDRPDALA